MKYSELVDYIKSNHINWNTDLFDVLKGFFEYYYSSSKPSSNTPIQQELIFPKKFEAPEDGEYTIQETLNLFNT